MLAEFVNGNGGASQWNEYLAVGNVKVGMRVERSDETVSLRYFHTDHLGSIAVITDENALVVERFSYDAWGKRRFADGADDPTGSIASQTTRGFTGHEHLAEVGLVHMNGRVYDPLVARMMSADPTVPDAMNPQAWNRYSYVGNDPLAFTDPSGYSWLSNFFRSIGNAIKSAFQQIPILRAVVQIAIAAILGPVGMGLNIVVAAAVSAAVVTGLSGGKLGDMLKAGAIAGATAFAFWGAGELTSLFPGTLTANGGHGPLGIGSPAHLFNVASHAAVGCGAAVASGGRCSEGALSAGVASAAGPFIPTKDFTARLVTLSVVGGAASVAGGGKFENGAVTAAFGYLFNEIARGPDGKLWATKPTADEMAVHYAGGSGESVYRLGSDVDLGAYPLAQFNQPKGTRFGLHASSEVLAAGLANWAFGTLSPGALTDAFIYGSVPAQSLGNGYVQLSRDWFNFDMHGRPWRDFMTWTQHQTLGGGKTGKNFETIFVGPTRTP